MKKISFIAVILILCFVSASSQSCLPYGITFNNQAQIDSFQINNPGCIEIEGPVTISGDDITNLSGLSMLTSVWYGLDIRNNGSLTSLTGLDNLTSIGLGLWIWNNSALTSIAELSNLVSAGGILNITENDALTSLTGLDNVTTFTDIWIDGNDVLTSLTGLEALTSLEGELVISYNDALTSLTGFDNVSSMGFIEIYFNDALTSLTGIDNVHTIGGDFKVYFNGALSTCEVQSVCDYLADPSGTVVIHDNAPGCNSQEEVEEACGLSVEEQHMNAYLSLFPNPAKQEVNISTDDDREIEEVCIYTLIGQRVMQERSVNGILDISRLLSGMYIVEVTVENVKLRQKLVKLNKINKIKFGVS